MEEQELKNFLRGEGVELTEITVPTIDVSERCLIDIADEIENEGLEHLIKNIGTITNTFKTENDFSCSPEVLAEGIKLILTAMQRLYNMVTGDDGYTRASLAKIDRATKLRYRKYLAVLCFLIQKSFVEIERAASADAHNISAIAQQQIGGQKGRRGGRKQQTADDDDSKYQFWLFWRPKLITELLNLFASPMEEIWEGNLDGYNFPRCITLALCNVIKNNTKRLRQINPETEESFEILGILAAKHQEEKGILSRLIPLLKGSEEAANIIADGINRMILIIPEDKRDNIIMRALTEALDTYMAKLERDSGAEKGFHAFLTRLSSHQPKAFIYSIAVVVQFLEAESPTVRNGVIIVAHQLMNWTWDQMKAEEANNAENEEDLRDERPNVKNWLNLRTKLLEEILLLHNQDVAAVVRTKSLQMLADIVKNNKIVPAEGVKIMKHVKLRLLDKNNMPRKNAASLVIDVVQMYPYIARPADEFLRKRKEKLDKIVDQIQKDNPDNPGKALYFIIKEYHLHRKTMDGFIISPNVKKEVTNENVLELLEKFLSEKRYWEACEVMYLCLKKWGTKYAPYLAAMRRNDDDPEENIYLRFFKATCDDIFPGTVDELELEEVNYIVPKKILDVRDYLNYILCTLRMKEELDNCEPYLRKLLELGTTTDKKEAIMFFAEICRSGYKPDHAVTVSIINALAQLTDEELKEFVDPFKVIFIGPPDHCGPHGIVKKLIELVEQLSDNLVESMSSIIAQLYTTGSLNAESIKILWDAFSLSTGGWDATANASCSAVRILGIIGQIERKIITSNLNQLIDVGLGERGVNNYELAKVTLQTIFLGCRTEQEVPETDNGAVGKGKSKAVKKATSRKKGEEIKFPPTHELFDKIVRLIENGMTTKGDNKMDIMYPRVAELSMQIIYRMCTDPTEVVKRFLPNIQGYIFPNYTKDLEVDPFKQSERLLFRYMSFGKAFLGSHITYYERDVAKELKERKSIKEKSSKKNKTASRQRPSSRSSLSNATNTTNNSMLNQTNQEAAAEMDMVMGHIGFDAEQDKIKSYVTNLLDQGFFRQFRLHVLYFCQSFNTIKSVNLKVACVQALAKLMLVCEASIRSSLDIFSNIWNGQEPFVVKLELLRAAIRLTVKFPNQMEKMNESLSSGLSSKDVNVRKACMDYICYLSLTDLLKVRQQLSEVAACLCDESFDLREMAKDFINQISEKDNVLQNCIPDITARLSDRTDIPQTSFQNIMKILLQKIKKEKQLGGLVEKFVQRFKGIVPIRHCQDTIYCLNQIPQNEKTLKIVRDGMPHYADKLGDAIVWDLFMELLNTFKKLQKPELKTKIEEWERELEEHHTKCVALLNADNAAKRKNEKQRIVAESSSEDEEGNDNEDGGEEPMNEGEEGEENANDNNENGEKSDEEADEEMGEDGNSEGGVGNNEEAEENSEEEPEIRRRGGRRNKKSKPKVKNEIVSDDEEMDDD